MTAESFGMMNEAYFVGRQQLITWVNDLLDLNIKKVEECASGAIYCQIVDCVCGPGKVAMKRIDFDLHYEHEYVKNYKVLQDAFTKIGLEKLVPVDRLTKARHQDNLEFLQWMFQWYQRSLGTDEVVEYDGLRRRCLSKNGKTFKSNRNMSSTVAIVRKSRAKPSTKPTTASSGYGANNKRAQPRGVRPQTGSKQTSSAANKNSKSVSRQNQSDLREVQRKTEESQKRIAELTAVAKDLEKERDFYFKKILEVETLVKKGDDVASNPLIQKILDVLYSADDDDDVDGATTTTEATNATDVVVVKDNDDVDLAGASECVDDNIENRDPQRAKVDDTNSSSAAVKKVRNGAEFEAGASSKANPDIGTNLLASSDILTDSLIADEDLLLDDDDHDLLANDADLLTEDLLLADDSLCT
uniref:Microtubule-associated protein RP/EB family member 1C n=1 Tax=Hirondellea gigas TaxID=1518452 RepID=A0A2P2IAW0_9CRUS